MEANRSATPDNCTTDSEEEVLQGPKEDTMDEDITTPLLTEEKLRRKLQFFFMNPIEKWHAKLTLQLCLFANNRYNHIDYTWDNRVTFSHLFLNGWDSSREINTYPPSAGPLAIYKVDEFFETVNYALDAYAKLDESIGPYTYPTENNSMPPIELCLYKYKKGIIFGFNESYIFDATIEKECYNISTPLKDNSVNGTQLSFTAIVQAALTFSVKTVNFKTAGLMTTPNCYRFDISIDFDNRDHDGQMSLSLEAQPVRLTCQGDVIFTKGNKIDLILTTILNVLVILICCISCILCCRAIWRAHNLKTITNNFFKFNYHRELNNNDKMEFLNLWYIMIIINDILIIIGSAIKQRIEHNHFTFDQWNTGSVFLGTGNMLVWFGVLRYLGFFKTYNVVILTLKKAAPKVARFSLCALLIYAGFSFCGWLVLGPYHIKFRSLATTSECLFSLLNGDDMFATFSIMESKSTMLWWYSRIYLYCFISVYIYVILSLFIAVIMDAYDTIKIYYNQGFPGTDLHVFIGNTTYENVCSGLYRTDSHETLNGLLHNLCCCCNKLHKSYSSLRDSRMSLKNNVPYSGSPV
ncbi:hypothetical protein FQA39_LY05448 [Lamprigera yunnana]|nr:hypothetical protein FQA39_LY05448 [Lamprigera yunnana]